MSMYISEVIDWFKNKTTPIQLGGGVQVTGSLFVSEPGTNLSSGQLLNTNKSVVVLSGSGASNTGGFVSSSLGFQLQTYFTASLTMAKPTAAQLHIMLPNATTGSMFLVGSGSESWIVFKDIKGAWRTMTASMAG